MYSPNASQYSDFNATKNVLDESASLSVTWNDGDMLIVTVRAFDIFENYEEDTVTVYKDASPPEIRNLWLTRGDRVNISVHSIEDFSKMMYVIMQLPFFRYNGSPVFEHGFLTGSLLLSTCLISVERNKPMFM